MLGLPYPMVMIMEMNGLLKSSVFFMQSILQESVPFHDFKKKGSLNNKMHDSNPDRAIRSLI